MTDHMPRSLAAAINDLRTKTTTPQRLVEAALDRIASYDGEVSSVLHLDAAGALARAAQVDVESTLLAGSPLAIKDIIDVGGMPTTGNSRLPTLAPLVDADSVGALTQAGGIVLGKLAAWELGMGGTSFTLPWPPARNPWQLARDPGGSSTGSAAALAAGFCLGSLGSDTGGSIREPASWCGIAGFKPTHGLVAADGVMAASLTLDHVGPMARTSQDCAILMDALLGNDHHTRNLHAGIGGLRIGMVDLDGETGLHLAADVADALARAGRDLSTPASVLRATLPPLASFSAVCTVLAGAEGLFLRREVVEARPELFDPLTRQRLLSGHLISALDYVAATQARQNLRSAVAATMAGLDLLLMPTTRDTAPLLGGFDSHGGHPSLGRPWNVTGLPALSVRAGLDRNGLPIGLQVIGHRGADALVLRAGHAIEALFDGRDCWPELAGATAPAVDRPQSEDRGSEVPAELAAIVRGAVEIVRRYA